MTAVRSRGVLPGSLPVNKAYLCVGRFLGAVPRRCAEPFKHRRVCVYGRLATVQTFAVYSRSRQLSPTDRGHRASTGYWADGGRQSISHRGRFRHTGRGTRIFAPSNSGRRFDRIVSVAPIPSMTRNSYCGRYAAPTRRFTGVLIAVIRPAVP